MYLPTRLIHTKSIVLVTIAKIIEQNRGNWCLASQEKLLALLKEHHGIKIKNRALNYHLSDLRAEGIIKSIKRASRDNKGKLRLLSSATCITMKGLHYLEKMGYQFKINKAIIKTQLEEKANFVESHEKSKI